MPPEPPRKSYLRPPSVQIMRNLHLEPDPWQIQVMESEHPRLLLNCSRQSGKSTVVAIVALSEAMWTSDSLVLILSRSQRQSGELFRKVTLYFDRFDRGEKNLCKRRTAAELELVNGSRIICLPCSEPTIRGYSKVTLLVMDEAARVPDPLYQTARPMLAVSNGRLIALSTPFGKRGWFYHAWSRGGNDWKRVEIPVTQCSRITPEFLAEERRALGEAVFRREYLCSFEALEGLVYPDFARCVIAELPAALVPVDAAVQAGADLPPEFRGKVRRFGGIDFGFRNPFAALWGFIYDGVLYLTGEHYERRKGLDHHVTRMPKNVVWFADPSGAADIDALIRGNVTAHKGNNQIRLGIGGVTRRLESGTLKVLAGRCPNLLGEAEMYRYNDDPREGDAETPVDEHNHALAALRYLICTIDEHELARPKVNIPPAA
jgi:hypothetical protein